MTYQAWLAQQAELNQSQETMTTEEINNLLEEVKCYTCLNLSAEESLKLGLYRRWLLKLDPEADTSASALIAQGACYACYGVSLYTMLELVFLELISAATG